MSANGCLLSDCFPYREERYLDPMLLDDDNQHGLFSFDQSPMSKSNGALMTGLDQDFIDGTMVGDHYDRSTWSTPLSTYDVQYRDGYTYPYDDMLTFQGGPAGQWRGSESQYTTSPPYPSPIDEIRLPGSTRRGSDMDGANQSHVCDECQQDFVNLQMLDEHAKIKSHKAWRCTEQGCGKAYARRDGFTRHQHKHRDGGHACPVCRQEDKLKVFIRKDHLREHVKKCHPQSIGDLSKKGVVKIEPQKHEAMQVIIKSLCAVLGEGHEKLQGLESTMTALSDSGVKSVAKSIAESMAEVAATKRCNCQCN